MVFCVDGVYSSSCRLTVVFCGDDCMGVACLLVFNVTLSRPMSWYLNEPSLLDVSCCLSGCSSKLPPTVSIGSVSSCSYWRGYGQCVENPPHRFRYQKTYIFFLLLLSQYWLLTVTWSVIFPQPSFLLFSLTFPLPSHPPFLSCFFLTQITISPPCLFFCLSYLHLPTLFSFYPSLPYSQPNATSSSSSTVAMAPLPAPLPSLPVAMPTRGVASPPTTLPLPIVVGPALASPPPLLPPPPPVSAPPWASAIGHCGAHHQCCHRPS